MFDLFKHISTLAKNQPDSLALVRCNKEGKIEEEIAYRDLEDKIEKTAQWLLQMGLEARDVISLVMPSSPEFLIISWTCWCLGIITVPLDTKRDTINDHKFKLDISKAKIIIAKKGIFDTEEKRQLSKYKIVEIDRLSFESQEKNKLISWKTDLDYLALILFTSGTTSHPKGAELTLNNLIVNAEGIKKWFNITKDDRFMAVLPLYHINSTSFCLSTLLSGGSIVLSSGYSNSRFWQELALTSSTFTSIVPSICFDQLSRDREFEMFKNKLKINRIQIGSAPVIASDVKKFMQLYKIPMYQGYGQTETALRVTGVPLDLDKKTYDKLITTNSIGKPMDWAEVKIMDDNGKLLKENEDGELAVKGDAIMKGYLNTKEGFKNGYFLTGDIGYFKIINGERYFFLKGRKKEIIIKGGINISPVAIENKLKEVFKDIDQVFVIGVADRRYGEEILAVICWKENNFDKARANLKYTLAKGTKEISRYETPKYVVTIDPKSLPATSTGKVQRSLLKNKISKNKLEPINLVAKTNKHSFIFLKNNSLKIKEAFELYNYCWYPLTLTFEEFKERLLNETTIIAFDKNYKVVGLISLMRLDISENKLSSLKYSELRSLKNKSLIDNEGNSLVCVSICSSNYKQEPVPQVSKVPTEKEVREYLFSGKDSVFNFHSKPKGGFDKGATLVKLLPNARPEDKRSLGYNMLLKYPKITKEVCVNENASVAVQFIETVMLIAKQFGIENVYAFSRPADLAKFI